MRWITFLILLFITTALQTSHLGGIPFHEPGGKPLSLWWPAIEWLPLLAIFYALYAAEPVAPLAALFCGLAYDIFENTFIGTNLIPLALVGLLLVKIRLSIFREHFISQLLMSLLAILAFGLFSVLFRRLIIGAPVGVSPWNHFATLAGNAVYSALIAPFLFYLLFRFHTLLGFTPHGPRSRNHI